MLCAVQWNPDRTGGGKFNLQVMVRFKPVPVGVSTAAAGSRPTSRPASAATAVDSKQATNEKEKSKGELSLEGKSKSLADGKESKGRWGGKDRTFGFLFLFRRMDLLYVVCCAASKDAFECMWCC